MKEKTIERIRKFTEERDWDQFHSPANLVLVIPVASEIPMASKEKRFLRIGSSKCNIKDYPIMVS